jgi:hypothetical protein
MTGLPWDASYHDGPAPWDIGRPQPTVVRLATGGGFAGAVLDAGCGTGENAVHIAALGVPGPAWPAASPGHQARPDHRYRAPMASTSTPSSRRISRSGSRA